MVLKPLKNAKIFASGGACAGLFCLRRRLRRALEAAKRNYSLKITELDDLPGAQKDPLGVVRIWGLPATVGEPSCFSSSVPPPNHPEGVPAARKYIALRRELTFSLPSDALIVVGI